MMLLLGTSVFLPVFTTAILVNNTIRNGKHLGLEGDEILRNAFDEVGSAFHLINNASENYYKNSTEIIKTNRTKSNKFLIESDENGPSTDSDHSTMKPVAETPNRVVLFGGAHYNYRRPEEPQIGQNNNTGIKIFWTTFGEAVESIPFLPIHLNFQEMISAMANFLVTYVPLVNRFGNQNNPREPLKFFSGTNQTEKRVWDPEETNYYLTDDEQSFDYPTNRREYRVRPEANPSKKRRKNKRKSNGKGNTSKNGNKIFQFPNLRRTTMAPSQSTRLWLNAGADRKELIRVKNIPIIRKRIRIADREMFNFKNSDISNSPIMILNVPNRPITQFKIVHKELEGKQHQNLLQEEYLQQQQQKPLAEEPNVSVSQSDSTPKSIHKRKRKTKRPSRKAGERSQSKSKKMETTTVTVT